MVTRKEIAKQAAKIAVLGAYKAIMNAPVQKVATDMGVKDMLPPVSEVGKRAAAAAYNGVMKAAQVMQQVAPDESNVIGLAMRFGPRNVALRLQGKEVAVSQAEVDQFLQAVGNEYGDWFKDQVADIVAEKAPYQPVVAPKPEAGMARPKAPVQTTQQDKKRRGFMGIRW